MALTIALVVWTTLYVVTCAQLLRTRVPAPLPQELPPLRVLLVRPCTGAPELLARTLPSRPIGAPAGLRWIAAVEHPGDAAWGPALTAAALLRTHGIDADVLATAARGPNHKVDQLARAVEQCGDDRDVLVVVDADVDLGSLDLARLVAPLRSPRVAASWCPSVEVAPRTPADRLGAAILSGSLHAFVTLHRIDPRLFVGKTFAVRLDALASIGGLAALREHLGEDFELARRLHVLGLTTVCVERPVRSLAHGRDLGALLARHTRWLAVLRAQRKGALASVPLVLAAAPLLLALAIAASAFAPTVAVVAGIVVLAARLGVVVLGRRASGLPLGVGELALALPADLVLLAAFVRCLGDRRVRWADRTLRLGRDGRLEPTSAQGDPGAGDPIEHCDRERGLARRGP